MNLFSFADTKILKGGNVMKSETSASEGISNAVLATRYLALQELRERVRLAEEQLASRRVKKVAVMPAARRSNTRLLPKSRNW